MKNQVANGRARRAGGLPPRPLDPAGVPTDPRRRLLALLGVAPWLLGGCAAHRAPDPAAREAPVAVEPPPRAVSTGDEALTAVDAQLAPHQFSLDLGFVEEGDLHQYLEEVAQPLQAALAPAALACRVRAVNAHHLNAYAFPGGTLGVTRGLLLALENEGELAALLALLLALHADGQVARALPRDQVRERLLASTVSISQASAWAPRIGLAEPLGGSPLLGRYDPAALQQADRRALAALQRVGYAPTQLPTLLDRLARLGREQPPLLATLQDSLPDDAPRRELARRQATARPADPAAIGPRAGPAPARWARRMAWLQSRRAGIEACQAGELAMLRGDATAARAHFEQALARMPQDYAAHLRLAQALQAQGQWREALVPADRARALQPREAQAHRLAATLHLALRDGAAAWLALEQYDRLLPGDPGVIFLQGVAYEVLGRTRHAAEHYRTYLRVTRDGQAAQFAQSRLKALGYSP